MKKIAAVLIILSFISPAVFAAEAAPADVNRPPEDLLHKGRLRRKSILNLGVDLFIDARHAQHDGGADDAHVFLQETDVSVERNEVAHAEREVIGRDALERMRKRQKREPYFVDARTDAAQNAVDVCKKRAVREHDALGFACRARRVDKGGEVGGLGAGRQFDALARGKPVIDARDGSTVGDGCLNAFFGDHHGLQIR